MTGTIRNSIKKALDSYPHTKTVLVKLWSPLKKIQQHSRTTKTKLRNAQEEKEDSLVLPSSSNPSSQYSSAPSQNTPGRKTFSTKKGRVG